MCSATNQSAKVKELDDIELNELGESVRTTQCLICLKHSTEGTIYCGCGWCLIPLKNTQTSLQILGMQSGEENRDNAMEMKSGNNTTGKPWTLPKLQETKVYVYCKKVERRAFLPRHSAKTWTVSRIMHVPGQPYEDPDNLQSYAWRTKPTQKSLCMEESDKPR